MKELKIGSYHICDIYKENVNFLFSSFQCKNCDFNICEKNLDKIIAIKQSIKQIYFLEFKKVKSFFMMNMIIYVLKKKKMINLIIYFMIDIILFVLIIL